MRPTTVPARAAGARAAAQRIDRRDGYFDIAILDESAKATKLNRIGDHIVSRP
jgi:hypothetical protein